MSTVAAEITVPPVISSISTNSPAIAISAFADCLSCVMLCDLLVCGV